jgi:hypothetical protein
MRSTQMPSDNEEVPDVSMVCSVYEEPSGSGNVIVNLATPNPLADLGPMHEVSPGTWYASGPPTFVGAMPMRQDLTILPLPADSDSQEVSSVSPEEPFVIHESDMNQIHFEPVSDDQEGQVLVATDSGPQWGPVPSHLQVPPGNGGVININHGSALTEGSIQFYMAGGLEVIRIEANGDFYVHGRKVDNDHEIYQHFRKFLGMSFSLPVPDPRPRDGIETRYERIVKKCTEDQ